MRPWMKHLVSCGAVTFIVLVVYKLLPSVCEVVAPKTALLWVVAATSVTYAASMFVNYHARFHDGNFSHFWLPMAGALIVAIAVIGPDVLSPNWQIPPLLLGMFSAFMCRGKEVKTWQSTFIYCAEATAIVLVLSHPAQAVV